MIWSGRFIAVIQPEFPSLEDLIFSCINPKGNKSHLDALAASASLNKCSLWCVHGGQHVVLACLEPFVATLVLLTVSKLKVLHKHQPIERRGCNRKVTPINELFLSLTRFFPPPKLAYKVKCRVICIQQTHAADGVKGWGQKVSEPL